MDGTVVKINQGKLRGKIVKDYKGGNYYSFQGIPYAKPPIGNLRFKSPVAPEKWEGIRDATKEGSSSLSRHFLHRDKIIGSEDCLYLNVYTPELPKNEDKTKLKPVMFWIHGGGFIYGSGNTEIYGPGHLITGDVVIVTFNYRLGVLGFLSLEDSSLDVPGNAGLKDMVLALKWVQKNIDKFKGDPKNVTIFGESAGASSTHLLMLSPMAKGLFHRAILHSGCAVNFWVYGSQVSSKIAKVLKLNTTNEKELLEYLRKIPAEKFIDIQTDIKDNLGSGEIRPFGVVIEKPSPSEPNFITQSPLDIIASGNYTKVPIIIGYSDLEGLLTEVGHIRQFGSLQIPSDLSDKVPYLYNIPKDSELFQTVKQKMEVFYFGNQDPRLKTAEQFLILETDFLFWRGIFVTIREHLKNLNVPMYFYRLTVDSNLNFFKKLANIKRPGVSHCDILGYLFQTDYTSTFDPNSLEGRTVERMVTLWTNFAKTSNPNSNKIDINWDPTQKECYNFLEIGPELKIGIKPDHDRMKFWDELETNFNIKYKF